MRSDRRTVLAQQALDLWRGPRHIPTGLHLEWQLVVARWLAIAFVLPALAVMDLSAHDRAVAKLIIGTGAAYNLFVHWALPRRTTLFASGYLTAFGDTSLSLALVLFGGGFATPFVYFLFTTVIAVAMRYGYRLTLLVVIFVIAVDGLTSRGGVQADANLVMRSLFMCISVLLTSYVRAQAQHESRHKTAILDQMVDAVLVADASGAIQLSNRRARVLFPFAQREGLEEFLQRHFPPLIETAGIATAECVVHDAEGLERLVWITRTVLHQDLAGGTGTILVVRDITERKQATDALQHQALHDALTDLPNRIQLRARLQEAILLARGNGTSLALLVLDLDRFKDINDTFGHQYGDRLLRQIGSRLRSVLRDSDVVARLGGDEFAVLVPGADTSVATVLAQQFLRVLSEPFALEEQRVQVGASIGLVASPEHGTDAESLLRRADIAMYVAKSSRRGLAVYNTDQDHHSAERLALVGELRHAIDESQLVLYYQPKVDRSRLLDGVEALVRWQHPSRGLVSPDVFIGLAEDTGLIKPLTRWVLDAALRQCRHWLDSGHRIPIAVNVSTQDLQDEALPDLVAGLLKVHHVPADCLRVEITESAIMSEPTRARRVLTNLRHLGVGLSVDDFGTGYSSLAYLKQLPVDELKIDRSFIRDLAADPDDAAIVRSTIGLGHELGLRVIAEGVEDETTWRLLDQFGCDLIQGNFVSCPLVAAHFDAWLSEPTPVSHLDVATAA